MEIRRTTPADKEEVLALYEAARRFMAENGNPNQWVNGYPGADQLEADMAAGGSYVCVREGKIVGTFYFAVGDEPQLSSDHRRQLAQRPALRCCPPHYFRPWNPWRRQFLPCVVLCPVRQYPHRYPSEQYSHAENAGKKRLPGLRYDLSGERR